MLPDPLNNPRRTSLKPSPRALLSMASSPTPLIGETRVPLPPLRIKVTAVHAGLSLLPVSSKVSTSSTTASSSPSLNNNSLIVTLTSTKVATVVSLTELLVMLPKTVSNSNLTIPTLLETESANTTRKRPSSSLVVTKWSLPNLLINLRLPSSTPPLPFPSKLMKMSSNSTAPVSSERDALLL